MFNRKFSSNIRRKKRMIISSVILLVVFLTTGYAVFTTSLGINGTLNVSKYDQTLYGVLKKAVSKGYAREYTGEHQDSMAGVGTQKIYHWYAPNTTAGDTLAEEILDKNNVIFADHCWQMIRTTDTGGVKMIYNGEANDNKCNNTGDDSLIGKTTFNYSASVAYVGYMYNKKYYNYGKNPNNRQVLKQTFMTNSTNYYYGTDITYDSSTNQYVLVGTTQDTWTNKYSSASGLYTCKSATSTQCSTVYYIVGGRSGYMYGFSMTGGKLLNYYNTNLTLGTSYTDNGDGTYTLNDITTITKIDWFSVFSTYNNYYTCGNDAITCNDMEYITGQNNYTYDSILVSDNYIYSKNFIYNNETNTYILGDDRIQMWNITDSNISDINTHHYTCFNDTGECNSISYVFRAEIPTSSFYSYIMYINLLEGKSVEDAINEMLYDDDVNAIDSNIKEYIDNWYANNLSNYTSNLEDTIFCNNRKMINPNAVGWNADGGNVKAEATFSYSTMICSNDTDKFSMSNSKAKLIYPVSLITYAESKLLNNKKILGNSSNYWLGSPKNLNGKSAYISTASGHAEPSNDLGVRPVISLKPGTEYASGTGSMDDPYVVEVPMGTLTIQYINELGAVIHEPFVVELPIGATYNYVNPIISGYEATESSATGTLNATSKTHVVTYTDSSGPPLVGD